MLMITKGVIWIYYRGPVYHRRGEFWSKARSRERTSSGSLDYRVCKPSCHALCLSPGICPLSYMLLERPPNQHLYVGIRCSDVHFSVLSCYCSRMFPVNSSVLYRTFECCLSPVGLVTILVDVVEDCWQY